MYLLRSTWRKSWRHMLEGCCCSVPHDALIPTSRERDEKHSCVCTYLLMYLHCVGWSRESRERHLTSLPTYLYGTVPTLCWESRVERETSYVSTYLLRVVPTYFYPSACRASASSLSCARAGYWLVVVSRGSIPWLMLVARWCVWLLCVIRTATTK